MRLRTETAVVLFAVVCAAAPDSRGQVTASAPAMHNLAQLPLSFARTHGGPYIAQGQGYSISLDNARAVIGNTVSLEFAGAKPGLPVAGAELPGKVNIIEGNDPKQWQLGLPTYGRVSWPNVYPGIDVVYYGNQQQLEFDLVVKPGADPSKIRLKTSGAGRLSIDGSGALDLGASAGGLRIGLPLVYQEINGAKKNLGGHYEIAGKDEVAFRVDPWDHTQPLVIDPTIIFSTVFGGGNSSTSARGIQRDSSGNILIAGSTSASDFLVANAAQITLNGINGNSNAFISKANPTGTVLVYSTYFGGSNGDEATAIAVDSTGSAWITGDTQSADFPLLNAAQSTLTGGSAAFVAKLSSSGVLQFSTYLASSGGSQGNGIAVDGSQNGYVTGYSNGTFPTTSGAINTTSQSYDAFVTKYSSTGTVVYSTLLGGSDIDGAFAIAVDSTGAAYVTGISLSSSFTGAPAGGAQTTNGGLGDVFVTKLAADAKSILYFTFLGGAGSDAGDAIAIDSSLNAYIAGGTESTGLATTGAAQTTLTGSSNGFVAKLNAAGSTFTYVTYIGGSRTDSINGITLDGSGNVYVTGQSDSINFPVVSAIQPTLSGNQTGLFSSADSGATWTAFDSALPAGTYDVSINPTGASAVALTESGVYRTTNGGTSWSQQTPAQSLVQNNFRGNWGSAFLSRSPVTAGTIYAVICCNTVYKSTDDGVTWNTTAGSPSFNSPLGIVADPLTAGTVYVFGNGFPNVSKSIDGGDTWNSAISGLPGNQVVAMAAGSDGALYLDTQNGGLYKSTNHAGSWTALSGLSGTFTPNPFSLSVSGTTVYFVASGNFYKSTNGGTTWTTSTAPGGGVGEVAASPQSASVVYVYSYNNSVYASSNGGATWSGPGTGYSASNYTSQELVVDGGNSAHVVVVSPVNQVAVVAKVKSDGSALTWSTYLGGVYGAKGNAVTTDGAGNAYVTGNSYGGGFPVTTAGSSPYGAFGTVISDATGDCSTLSVSPTSAIVTEYSGQFDISVLAPSGCAWTASTNAAWAVISSGTSGTGSGTITISSIGSNLNVTQTATLTVGTQTVALTQPSNSCSYILNKTSYGVPQGGGTFTANLNAQSAFAPSCPWSVTNNDPNAVTITSPSPAQGTGSGAITLRVAANPGLNLRTFSLPVGSTTLNIVQGGTCTFSLSAPSVSVAQGGAPANSVTVTPSSQLCTWSATTNNGAFLTISIGSSGTGTGTIVYSVQANPTNPRTGTLTIAGLTFTVNQAGIVPGYLVSTLTGGKAPAVAIAGASTVFGNVAGLATDPSGNAYLAVPQLDAVYRLDGTGALTRFAGTGVAGFSGDGNAAVSAQLSNPRGVAVDTSGNVYISDSSNQRIRKVTTAGIISTVAGNGTAGIANNGGTATFAEVSNPGGLATDSSGNLYIADTGNNRIRKVAGGVITTIAGNGSNGFAGDGAAATGAQLSAPQAVVVDSSGNFYIADSGNNRVRKVSGSTITTFAGTNVCCVIADGGPATSAWLASPQGLTLDAAGNVYISDTNNERVREVTSNGVITTIVGTGNYGFKGDGGVPTSAQLRAPVGLAFDQSGNLLIADEYNQRVRKVSSGTITTVAGGGPNGDGGPVSFATLGVPGSVAQDASGNFFIADTSNNVVRRISAAGVVSTVAGTGVQGYSGDGAAATAAILNQPQSVAVDANGNLYIYDSGNDRIRKVDTGGNITTIAGNGSNGFSGDGATATSAQISFGYGVAVDSSANVYIADTNNHRVRKVSGGTITTVAGNGSAGYSGDTGTATNAQLNSPYGVALDPSGTNLYIADASNHRIRKVTGGTITTAAGNGSNGFSGDGGAAASAQINNPRGVAVDGSGNLYIADANNNRIREVLASGTIVTLGGTGSGNGSGDGGQAINATFRTPQDVIVDATGNGNLYVADTYNNDIRFLTTTLPVLAIGSSHTGSFSAGGTGSYTLTVSNASAAATSGTVTVTEILPSTVTLSSMSGSGWTCTGNSCVRSDALVRGTPYPAITVSVNLSGTAPSQVMNEATASGGGAFAVGTEDLTLVTPAAPGAPVLTAPANGATNVSLLPMLTWTAATEATSYAVYFGTSATPPFLANTTDLSFTPPALALNTTYFWQVVATNTIGTNSSAVFSFTTYGTGFCTFALSPAAASFAASGGTGSVTVTTAPGCVWSASSNQSWLALASAPAGTGSGTILYSASPNSGQARSANLTIGGQAFTVTETTDYLISTITGGLAPASSTNANAVAISSPAGIATDSFGNTYVAMPDLNAVYRVDGAGVLTRFAGTGVAGFSGDAGAATSANLNGPQGVTTDAAGDVFIADSYNQRVRKVDTSGVITTVAGTGTCCYSGDGAQATNAQLNYPTALTVDSAGVMYIVDTNNHRIRKVASGIITTLAGNGTSGFSGDGAAATGAQLNSPSAVASDGRGNVYIADRNNNRVREVSGGTITTIAGSGVCCNINDGGPATSAWLASPGGLLLDSTGHQLYIADTNNNRVRLVIGGNIYAVAGSGAFGNAGDGASATTARLSNPTGLAFDRSGNLLFSDTNNQRVRGVTGGVISTVIGGGPNGDGGPAPFATPGVPGSVAKDAAGNIYFPDPPGNRIRMISASGVVSTFAGTGVSGYSGDGAAATAAKLNNPLSIAIDGSGNIFIADAGNYRIRKVDTSGKITTVAGNGTCCFSGDGGAATSAQLNTVWGLAVDTAGSTIYIADSNNQRIRRVSGGNITTIAGNGTNGFSGDGAGATLAQLNNPNGVAVDGSGNVYIADSSNGRVRKVSGGNITTVAGTGICCFAGDGGPATSAQMNYPRGVFVDGGNNIYIADSNDERIREVTATGTILTIAGNGTFGYAGDGGSALNANLRGPQNFTLDGSGNIYVADTFNNAIRQLTPAGTGPVLTISSAHSGSFTAGSTGSYTVTVSNAALATTPSGTVTVTEILPAGLTLGSMSGTNWNCTGNTCTRSDVLNGGASYPAVTVSVNVSGTAPLQVTNEVTVSGGGANAAGGEDTTQIVPGAAPAAPVLISPANSATNVSIQPTLTWAAVPEATSYLVLISTSSTAVYLANTTALSITLPTLPTLALNTTYNWDVTAINSVGLTGSAVFSFTTYGNGFCTYVLSPAGSSTLGYASPGGAGSVTVTAPTGCVWTGASNQSFVNVTSGAQGSGNGTVNYTVAASTGGARSATLTIAGQTITINEGPAYLISTLTGGKEPAVAAAATAVTLTPPASVATDLAGNTFFAATQLNSVYRLDTGGNLTRIAGTGAQGYSGDTGEATAAMLNQPHGVATDAYGNVFIADSGNERIRVVTPGGIITTAAGTGQCCFSGDGGAPTGAQLNYPIGVAFDSAGNLYIADTNNNRVREVSNNVIITIAGNGIYGYSGDGGSATSAQLESPQAVAVDSSGNVYVSDTNNGRVRKISGGNINAFAGSGLCCTLGDGGTATSAFLNNPQGLAVDSQNNVYITDTANQRIRKVSGGNISTVAGNGNYSFGGDGGPAVSAWLKAPAGVAFDSSGNMLIADSGNQRIRKVSGGNINTIAGGGPIGDSAPVPFANLSQPSSIAKDSSGNVFIADSGNHRIREISAAGVVSTFAGTGVQGYSGDGAAATAAKLNLPQAIAFDSTGNLFIYDAGNSRIRKVDTNGNITTVAGNGTCCYSGDGASATAAQINFGNGLAVDGAGNIYIADTNNQRIRKVSGGNITTVAGNGTYGFAGDTGSATSAQLENPTAVAVDGSGNIFIADSNNNRVREVSGGIINTVAGNGTCCFSGDGGPATSAQFNAPHSVALDGAGNLYISDYNNHVREVLPSGTIVSIAGTGSYNDTGDGGAAISASFRTPLGMTVDGAGDIYVADTNNNAVRVLTPAATSPVLTIGSAHSGNFSAGGNGTYILTVGNAANAGPTNGAVTLTANAPAGMTLNSLSGSGWSCTGATCTRSDTLNGGNTYPSIAMSVATPATGPYEVTNQVIVSGGGSATAGASDGTIVAQPAAVLTTINPNFVAVGGPAVAVTVTGTGVATGSAITFSLNGTTTALPAQWQSSTQALVTIPASLLPAIGYAQIAMVNGSGTASNSLPFTISTNTRQTITFPALPDVPTGTPSVSLTATSDSGLTVTYTASTPVVCSVSGTTVTILVSGGCAITASQPGDTTYAPATPVTQKFTVLFADILPGDHYFAAVNAMAQHGITAGCGNNGFCPTQNVTRDQMAIFIVRAIFGNDNFSYNPTPYFADVTPTTFGFKWIQKMKDLGITNGCTITNYCPLGTVSRDQMAIFIIRARLGLALAGGQNPSFTYPSTPYFDDVQPGAFGYQWIQRMKEESITSGCTATGYCPSSPIIRGDMAIFIMRGAFNQFLPAGTPMVSQISSPTITRGTSGTYTITGTNTHFVQGTTTLSPIPGVTIGTITVTSATTMTVQLTAASNAVTQPYSILAITGTEEAVLPNGLLIQ